MRCVNIKHRITSIERWGLRTRADFQADAVRSVRDAGFTGVLVNGGSGFGPDMLLPETLADNEAIPQLMPLTRVANQREMQRRCDLLDEAGLDTWLCLWGVPGVDLVEQDGSLKDRGNRFDHRTKLEMRALFRTQPDLFGYRDTKLLSWRGVRPLCVSHPKVTEFYADLMAKLLERWPALRGILYFPGDHGAEICDDTCPRCRDTGLDPWQRMIRYVNGLYGALHERRDDFKLYYTFWNMAYDNDLTVPQQVMQGLSPGIGVCMSISDHIVESRKGMNNVYTQPWVICPGVGAEFRAVCEIAKGQDRPVMVLGEIAQSEIWDPPCHNMPNPAKILGLLTNARGCPGVDAVCDFWGHRGPYLSHANLAAMAAWFAEPDKEHAELLRNAAIAHYGLAAEQEDLVEQALRAWSGFDAAVDEWTLIGWGQRFSPAIGRHAARGSMYRPLIPAELRRFANHGLRGLERVGIQAGDFNRLLQEDRVRFIEAGDAFRELATLLEELSPDGAKLAEREADNIALAGELIGSQGRIFAAASAYAGRETELLRELVREEVDARHRQLEVSAGIGVGEGIDPFMVGEDIQNMMLFVSSPDCNFSITPMP